MINIKHYIKAQRLKKKYRLPRKLKKLTKKPAWIKQLPHFKTLEAVVPSLRRDVKLYYADGRDYKGLFEELKKLIVQKPKGKNPFYWTEFGVIGSDFGKGQSVTVTVTTDASSHHSQGKLKRSDDSTGI